MGYTLCEFDSREAVFDDLAPTIAGHLVTSLKSGKASILLSGGTTPGPLFDRLAVADLDWDNLVISLTDDRWVEADDPASNERLVRNSIMSEEGRAATFLPLKAGGATPFDGLAAVRAGLAALPRPIDIVLMGMGADGHCASLFPESPDLQDALNSDELCWPMRRDEGELARMSMTRKALLDSRHIILLFFGDEKLAVLKEAAKGINDLLPVSYFLCQDQVPVTVYWAP